MTGSLGNRRYRAISRNSHIDESLFCSAKAGAKVPLPFNRPGKYGACELPSEDTSKRGLIAARRSASPATLGESTVLLRCCRCCHDIAEGCEHPSKIFKDCRLPLMISHAR